MRLSPAATYGPWVNRHVGGLIAITFGAAALIAGFWTLFGTGREITQVADLRVVLPLAGIALISGIVAFVRRERQQGLAIGGMAMAAAAPVLGWVVLVAVVAVAAIVVLIVVAKFH